MGLEDLLIYVLTAMTSFAVVFVGITRLALKPVTLRAALREFTECLGASVLFFAFNSLLAIAVVFLVRGLWGFVSVYLLTNWMLVVISAFQGFVVQMWWRRSKL
jgi:hypothetical protein